MPAVYWYNQGTLSTLPSDITLIILEFLHPVYFKIHREIERLNKTLPNIDKYYLSGNIIPNDNKTPYDPVTTYDIKLDMVDFAILAYQSITCSILFQPIENITSRNPGEGMETKHRLEGVLPDKNNYIIDANGNQFVQVNTIPIKINCYRYMSRELSVLDLFVAGFKCRTKGALHYFKTQQDAIAGKYSLNFGYFQFSVKENNKIKKKQFISYNTKYGIPVFLTNIEIYNQKEKERWSKRMIR